MSHPAACFSRRLCLLERRGSEDQFARLEIHDDAAVIADLPRDEFSRKGRLDMALQVTLQRPSAINRVVALAGGVFLGGVGQLQVGVAIGKPSAPQDELKLDDAVD